MGALTEAPGADVVAAYDSLAPFYDAFTADYNHDSWMADVEAWARFYDDGTLPPGIREEERPRLLEHMRYASQLYDLCAWPALTPDLPVWLGRDPFRAQPPDKLELLADAAGWSADLGHPGPTGAATPRGASTGRRRLAMID